MARVAERSRLLRRRDDRWGRAPLRHRPVGPRDGHQSDWLQSIRTRERPICDVEVGCRSVTVCHLANLAYWLMRPLAWDPVEEEFIGDPEANRWLDRPKRAPWTM